MDERRSDLTRLFNPRGVAIVGASPGAARAGSQALLAMRKGGYGGALYPVNPKYATIESLPCFPSLAEVPRPCDVAVVAVPADMVPTVLRQCDAAGIPFAVIFSAGFRELGPRGAAAQAALDDALRECRVRVIGPNCQGLMNLRIGLMCGFGSSFMNPSLRPGELAMVSQSGGWGYGVVGTAQHAGIGFSYVVSAGNESDLGTLDFLEHFVERDEIRMVSTYIEGIRDGARLRRLGDRALALGKPILVWKVGNTSRGKRAAASHTANLTSEYEVYRTAFAQGAFLEIHEIDDLVDVARAFRAGRLPAGNRVAIVTISGGAGVLFADRSEEQGLELATLAEGTLAELKSFLPDYVSLENPFDLTGQGLHEAEHFNRTLRLIAADPNVDLVMMRASQAQTRGRQLEEFQRIMQATGKPILVVWGGAPDRSLDDVRAFEEANISWHSSPGRATRAAAALVRFSQRLQAARSPQPAIARLPRSVPVPAATGLVDEFAAKGFLAALGMDVVRERRLARSEIAALTDLPFPGPLVAKVSSPDIAHKSELGGVRLGLATLAELVAAVEAMDATVRERAPQARIDGYLIQEQVAGTEMIVGVKNDACFGPLVMLGMGGVFAEVMRDVALRFAPFGEDVARSMVRELRGAALLDGYRGTPAADVDALVRVLVAVSRIADAYRDEILEIDLNPVIVRPRGAGAVVADALLVTGAHA